ncbi:MAG: amidase [Geodermatophilaceae bacterium]|nr:amidase [Geodermatophilaceae bacterium]
MSLWQLTATELLERYRRRETSPVEVTEAALARIEKLDGEINAFALVDAARAMDAARDSERRWHNREPLGALDGVPVAIKDLFLTQDWPTLRGSLLIDPDQPWREDAPSVARLRENGAVLVGKTTTPEFGWKGVTDSPRCGITGNAWDPSRTAGGSSGGSASAVALGMVPLATGTDGGGSIRIPAGFSGIFGLKPTYGRIPLYPASPFGTLSHGGPMTRTVEDAALMMDVLTGFDSRDWSAMPTPHVSHQAGLDRGVAGMRMAFSASLGYVDVDPEVAVLVRRAVDVLAALGAEIEEVDPGFPDPVEAFTVLWYSGAAKSVEQFPQASWPRLDPGLQEICEQGRRVNGSDFLEATAERIRLGVVMGRLHETYDVLLTPTLPLVAFAAGHEVPDGWPSPRWTSWTPFSYPFNLTQQPAASLPCGLTSAGLPAGLQVVGPRHADTRVLAVCKAYQDAQGWPEVFTERPSPTD